MEAAPALFLDNVNATVLRSASLASVLTERPARVRVLGQSRMVALNSTAFIAMTGNGLARLRRPRPPFRALRVGRAHCEDPETRDFAPGFLEEIEQRRAEIAGGSADDLALWPAERE